MFTFKVKQVFNERVPVKLSIFIGFIQSADHLIANGSSAWTISMRTPREENAWFIHSASQVTTINLDR